MAVTSALVAGSLRVPFLAWMTTCSVSPDWAGKFVLRTSRARLESVAGNEKLLANDDPTARSTAPKPIRATSHSDNTILR